MKRIAISSMIPRLDMKTEIPELNNELKTMCRNKGFDFISNGNIFYNWHLCKDKVHLNYDGVEVLERNFVRYLKSLNLGNGQ